MEQFLNENGLRKFYELLKNSIDPYVFNVDYDTNLKFDVTELVVGSTATTAKLGVAVLGSMVLGNEG